MKKVLAVLPVVALALTGCISSSDDSKTSADPAPAQLPTDFIVTEMGSYRYAADGTLEVTKATCSDYANEVVESLRNNGVIARADLRDEKVNYKIRDLSLIKTPIIAVDDNPRTFDYEEMGVTSFTENVRAYLKIQDGCDNFCTYCLIPYRRGRSRSRVKDKIIEEAKYLIEQGYQEIILTGIHVGGYGKDLNNCSFSQLVKEVSNLHNLHSLRISSIEESEIDDDLIEMVANNPILAKHLHIPLQSGSDTVLARMNRKYNSQSFIEKLMKIRHALPSIALSTDVIVGFPGETEEEFHETIETIKKCDFNMLHVFPFSAREGTGAYLMKNQIDPRIKKERVNVLLNLSKELWDKYTNQFIGEELDVLIEKNDKENHVSYGHTSNYIDIKITNSMYKPGDIIKVNIEKDMIISK